MKIILDLDGTVVNKEGVISANLLNYFQKRSEGLNISICTGRFSDYVLDVVKKLKIIDTYHICDGGARIINSQGETQWVQQLEIGVSETASSLQKDFDVELILSDTREIPLEVGQAQMIIRRVRDKDLDSVISRFTQHSVDVQTVWYWEGHGHTLSITPTGIDKGFALQKLANLESFSLENCEIVADGDNDIPCFKICGKRIAMGNASDRLKKLADYCVDTVDNDGVIQAIESILQLR